MEAVGTLGHWLDLPHARQNDVVFVEDTVSYCSAVVGISDFVLLPRSACVQLC